MITELPFQLVNAYAIRKGSKWRFRFLWKNKTTGVPINITGFTAKFQVRKTPTDPVEIVDLANGSGITLGGSAGTVIVEILAAATDVLALGRYSYALELTSPSGDDDLLFSGQIEVILRGIE